MPEEFKAFSPSLKLTFSHIECHIHLEESTFLTMAIKIGKTYSKFTSKTEIKNGKVQFSESLSIVIDEAFVLDKNPRKQKCEIMLYRYHANSKIKSQPNSTKKELQKQVQDKQNKNLIGMASLSIISELFQQKGRNIRITNTFDRDAYMTCRIKIGQDIFQHQQQGLSSIGQKSNPSSINDGVQNQNKKKLYDNVQISWIQKDFKQKFKNRKVSDLNGSRLSEQSKPISTRQVGSFSERQAFNDYGQSDLSRTQNVYRPKKEVSTGRIKRNEVLSPLSKDNSYSQRQPQNHSVSKQNTQLFQLCNNLQNQNKVLMSKIIHLENHILNNSPQGDNNIAVRPQAKTKPLMIKQNKKFTTSISTTMCSKGSQLESIAGNASPEKDRVDGRMVRTSQNSKFKPSLDIISIKQMDNELENSKSFTPRGFQQQRLQFFTNNENTSDNPIHHHTLSEQLIEQQQDSLKIMNSVIEFSYIPQLQCPEDSKFQRSITHTEKNFVKCYTKFNSKKKHSSIGMVKQKDSIDSFVFYIEKKDFASQTSLPDYPMQNITINQNHAHSSKQQQNSLNQVKLTINGICHSPSKIGSQDSRQVSMIEKEQKFSERSTLDDINRLIEEKYRKNQKFLKNTNQKLFLQIKSLKKQKKQLQVELNQKKTLSKEQFYDLQQKSNHQENEIQQFIKMASDKETKIEVLTRKLNESEEQCQKLRKDLKQQKKNVSYFIKASNLNDQRQKEKQQEMKCFLKEQNKSDCQFMSQPSLIKNSARIQTSRLAFLSNQKPLQNALILPICKEQKGYKTERSQCPKVTASEQKQNMRLSLTKILTGRQMVEPKLVTYSTSEIKSDKEKSVSSKAIINLKGRSMLQTKRQIDLSQQKPSYQRSFVASISKINQDNEQYVPTYQTERTTSLIRRNY